MKFKIKEVKNQKILVDTNIWLYLFAPSFIPSPQNQYKVNLYDEVFNNLLGKNTLLFNSLIISEFINRCLRIDFNSLPEFNDFKKDYKNSKRYKESLKLTLKEVEKIYKLAKPIDDNFNEYKLNFFKENLDFNDSVILYQCLRNKFLLLTDDKDFSNYINTSWWMG
ncbi:MAG: type II toxin-antitoxin system VapC family toxin [Nautiliaceae bacterium]